jgi:hypothetical protein
LSGYKAEAIALRERVLELELSMDARIARAVDEAVSQAVAKATEPLLLKIAAQWQEILRLKAQIGKDSSNSSKPPSAGGFKKVANSREASALKQGGQRGHKGNRLNIPDNFEELKAAGKIEHNIVWEGVSEGEVYVSDYIVDLKMIPVYNEMRRRAGAPPQISYGSNIQALAVYLYTIGLVSCKRTAEFFHEITYGMASIAKGTIAKFVHEAAEAVNLEELIQDLLNGEVINVDETPIKTTERPGEDGKLETSKSTTANAYIRTYSNLRTTVLTAAARKTQESVIEDNILPHFHGIVSHDHESKFYNFGAQHATCGAHLSRELKGMAQLWLLSWADEFRAFFIGLNARKKGSV